jgi:hypothetical protein
VVEKPESGAQRGSVTRALHKSSLVGLGVGALIVVVWAARGAVSFGDLFGIGFVYGLGIGLICAVCAGGTEPTLSDPMNARNHWRGHLQIAAAIMGIATIGGIVSAIA